MAIVVLCRTISPVDLTASLLLAHYRETTGQREEVEWITENYSENSLIEQLSNIACRLKGFFEITVTEQKMISALSPTNGQITKYLGQILDQAGCVDGKIRIHHGSILVENNIGEKKHCRYFDRSTTGEVNLYDEYKKPCTIKESARLECHGSLNLCLLKHHGELAHLPWYCLDSEIEPIVVNEIISPQEGCSKWRNSVNDAKLMPCGYSIYDYGDESNKTAQFFRLTKMTGNYIRSRKKAGTRNCVTVIDKLCEESFYKIKKAGFDRCLAEVVDTDSNDEEFVIRNLIMISQLAQVMISQDRGYGDRVAPYRIPNMSRNEMVRILNDQAIGSLMVYKKGSLIEMLNTKMLINSSHAFGEIRNYCISKARKIFDTLYDDCFREHKASVGKMMDYFDTPIELLNAFDCLMEQREERKIQIVKGSIFAYDN